MVNSVQAGPVDVGIGGALLTVSCPFNQTIIGGGYRGSSDAVTVSRAEITTFGRGGTFTVHADDGAALGPTLIAFAYCVP